MAVEGVACICLQLPTALLCKGGSLGRRGVSAQETLLSSLSGCANVERTGTEWKEEALGWIVVLVCLLASAVRCALLNTWKKLCGSMGSRGAAFQCCVLTEGLSGTARVWAASLSAVVLLSCDLIAVSSYVASCSDFPLIRPARGLPTTSLADKLRSALTSSISDTSESDEAEESLLLLLASLSSSSVIAATLGLL